MERKYVFGRRAFLTGAGKYGALAMGGAAIPRTPFPELASATQQAEAEGLAVEEKGVVRLLGVVQRRPGLSKMQVKFRSPDHDRGEADRTIVAGNENFVIDKSLRPTSMANYYDWTYAQLTRNEPGNPSRYMHNIVADGVFGADGKRRTAVGNRDIVTEVSYERAGQKPVSKARLAPTPPDSLEPETELALVVHQVLASGTRHLEPTGDLKAMHFIKMSRAAAADPLKVWQTLHTGAIEAIPASRGGLQGFLQGYEVLHRLPGTAARQPKACDGEIPVPELVAAFWPKTAKPDAFQAAFEDYLRAIRQADKERVLDYSACFFLMVEEFEYRGGASQPLG